MRKATRLPSLTETLISDNHPAGVTFPFLPNLNLKPETGKTVEFGVNYKQNDILEAGDALRLKAAYLNNNVEDYVDGVTLSAFDPTSGCPFGPGIPICFKYQNFAKAKINGFELERFATPAGAMPASRPPSSTATPSRMKASGPTSRPSPPRR